MINQQLVDFIKSQLQGGASKEIITKELLSNGWTVVDVEEGFKTVVIPIPTPNSALVPPSPLEANVVLQPQIKYAGFWIRLGAYLIDGLVLIIPILILIVPTAFLIGIPKEINPESIKPIKNIATIINLLVSWTYFIFMTYKYQATLGKKAVGIKVFSVGLEKPTLGKIILRETIGRIISGLTLAIGYMMAGWTKKKQALHDKIAGTVVVYNDPNKKTPTWVIVVIVLFVIGIPFILGITSAIISGSLTKARAEADLKVKEALTSTISGAVSYFEENSSYLGFEPKISPVSCSSDPVANISSDGKQMAIFMKSCNVKTNYFCVNPVTNFSEEMANADDAYVNSGATVCYSEKDNKNEDTNNITKDEKAESPVAGANQIALTKIFKDNTLGYEIKYPDNWIYQKQEDKKTKATSINFIPDIKNPTMNFSITSVEVGNTGIPDSMALSLFTGLIQKDITNAGGKYNGTKDYIYKFSDGTILVGNEFESEYTQGNDKIKQWDVVILNGKKIFLARFVFDVNGYNSLYETVKAMFGSWIIKK